MAVINSCLQKNVVVLFEKKIFIFVTIFNGIALFPNLWPLYEVFNLH